MARYAKVIVDISLEKLDRTFTYGIPGELQGKIKPGMQVEIPFGNGNRVITGYVLEVTDRTGFENMIPGSVESSFREIHFKDIRRIVPGSIPMEGQLIALASWMRQTYGCTMNQALKTVLPVKRQMEEQKRRQVRLLLDPEETELQLLQYERDARMKARFRVLAALRNQSCLEYGALLRMTKVTADVIRKMEEQKILRVESETVIRSVIPEELIPYKRVELNAGQRRIADEIREGFVSGDLRPCLIHGVTGSGKTEIYMELIEDVIRRGREAIVLIPEIALTYQTVGRFYQRFGGQVAVLHSRMSQGERHDQFELARSGQIKVMIGPRSALFAPFGNLGMIIIDEEHENSYKSETIPRYHARETAVYRAGLSGAQVILGSATPSVDAYYRAARGEYRLFELSHRVEGHQLPRVSVVDLRTELASGNRSVFSRELREKMEQCFAKKQQILLFLNRRGFAGFVSCRTCGHVIKCSHCDVSLTLHKNGRMVCHYCGYEETAAKKCPSCGSPYIGAFRAGTQQIEEAVRREFPGAKVLRMDGDTTKTKDSYEKILHAFAKGEADILIGTQMIVKGHDFPGVTLVGVLAADLSLHASDYRAAERTFQLLTQAAGRAGRGAVPGEVVIQTYQPEHYSVTAASQQDYKAFYQQEILYRHLCAYPPTWELWGIYMTGQDEEELAIAAAALRTVLERLTENEQYQIIGPADAVISKVQDQYRKVLYIKGEQAEQLRRLREKLEGFLEADCFKNINIQFDKNPMNGF